MVQKSNILSALERKDLTWTGSCILKTGFNSGRIRSTYSCDVQSSAISNTLGRANGTIWWLLNSEHNCGKTLCITTRWWWNTKNGNQVQPSTHNVNSLTLNTLTSVCIFSLLFSILFLRCCQGEFVWPWRASFVGKHFLYSRGLTVWFRG